MEQRFSKPVIFDYQREPSRDILCLDCRSFYASVECADRGWDALTTELVVMSGASEATSEIPGGGLILAASPAAKKAYQLNNVSRARDLPHPYPQSLQIVPPRMSLYIEKNREINQIYQQFADDENHHVYSIDESFLDVTNTLHLFKAANAFELARKIQYEVYYQTGIYVAVGIGDNPLLAKLALDHEAKNQPDMKAEWRYENVPQTVWNIQPLTKFWGIGSRMARRLQAHGIQTIYDLAHSDYYYLKQHFGSIGAQLYAHSWGIDRTFLGDTYLPKSKSLGNSQVLPRDYQTASELRSVIKEMADQVGTRLRRQGLQAQSVSLSLGYSLSYLDPTGRKECSRQMRIPATNQTKDLSSYLLQLFTTIYDSQIIRTVSVRTTQLVDGRFVPLNLFVDPLEQLKHAHMEQIVDKIRQKYGFTALVYGHSLQKGGRAIARSHLVGGHAGGMAGMEGPQNEKNI